MSAFTLSTIRGRLIAGFSLLVLLLVVAGGVGRMAIGSISRDMGSALATVRSELTLTASLTTNVARELESAVRYLERGVAVDRAAFRAAGFAAHEALRLLNASEGLTSTEVGLIATIDERLSTLEVGLAQAHLLRDLGRTEEATARADAVRAVERELSADVDRLGAMRAEAVSAFTAALQGTAAQRQRFLLAVIVGAILLGMATFVSTLRSIDTPLRLLVSHARALSQGRLDIRTEGELPGEFQELAEAMNTTASSLSRMATVANATAEEVATSAHQLTSAADQISTAASQTATAMSDVTSGAELQVSSLREADLSLQAVRERAHEVKATSSALAFTSCARSRTR